MLSGIGTIHVSKGKDRVVVDLSRDFIPYYLWLFKKENWINLHSSMHGGHITIANKKLHPRADYDQAFDITLGNVDKNGAVAMPYWPEMIEIKK